MKPKTLETGAELESDAAICCNYKFDNILTLKRKKSRENRYFCTRKRLLESLDESSPAPPASNCSFPPSHYQGIDWTNAKMPKSTEGKEAIQTERTLYILNHRQGFNRDNSRPCQESDNVRIK